MGSLAEIASRLRDGEPLDDDARERLAEFLDRIEPSPAELRAERDRLIREYRTRWYPRLSIREAARQIEADARRYAAGAWREHRHRASCPDAIAGTPRASLWRLFQSCPPDRLPGFTQLREILAG